MFLSDQVGFGYKTHVRLQYVKYCLPPSYLVMKIWLVASSGYLAAKQDCIILM